MVDGEKAATTYTIGWKPQPGPQTALLASAETSAAGRCFSSRVDKRDLQEGRDPARRSQPTLKPSRCGEVSSRAMSSPTR